MVRYTEVNIFCKWFWELEQFRDWKLNVCRSPAGNLNGWECEYWGLWQNGAYRPWLKKLNYNTNNNERQEHLLCEPVEICVCWALTAGYQLMAISQLEHNRAACNQDFKMCHILTHYIDIVLSHYFVIYWPSMTLYCHILTRETTQEAKRLIWT